MTTKKVFGVNIREMSQCQCLKTNGQQCKNKASGSTLFCWQHQNCQSVIKGVQTIQKAQKVQKTESVAHKVQKTPIKKKSTPAPIAKVESFIDDSLFGPLPPKKVTQSGYTEPMKPASPIPLPPKKEPMKEIIFTPTFEGKNMDNILRLINLPIAGYNPKTKKLTQTPTQFKQMLVDFAYILDYLDSIDTYDVQRYMETYDATPIQCVNKLETGDKVDHSQDRISVLSGSSMIACAVLSLYNLMERSDTCFLLYEWIESYFSKSPNINHTLIELLYVFNDHCSTLQPLLPCPYYRIKYDAKKMIIIDNEDIDDWGVDKIPKYISDRPLHKFSRY
jgi:hypothetical protein